MTAARKPEPATFGNSERRPYRVVIPGSRRREWGSYTSLERAEFEAAKLRSFGFDARVEGPR